MSETKPSADEQEREVLDYIRAHPDFLTQHPELLALLEVPHSCGNAVSLVEHQVAVLKDNNRRLQRKLRELVDNATRNQDRVQQLLTLSLDLLECETAGDVVTRLYRALGDDFQVDVARMRVFGKPSCSADHPGLVYVELDHELRQLFADVLEHAQPVCGRLRPGQLEFLFGQQRETLGSSALLPLGERGELGLLAIGSSDAQRFHPAQGTEFLQKLADLVSRALWTHVGRFAPDQTPAIQARLQPVGA